MKEQEALQWIAKVFEDAPERISSSTARKDIAGWDSMGTLILLAELDEKFSIHVSEDQIEAMQSVSDVLEILRSNGALEAA